MKPTTETRPWRGKPAPLMYSVTAAALAVLAVTVVSGCGSAAKSGTAPTSPAASGTTIVIKNFAFQPSDLTVAPGATVTVRNQDTATHTVTSAGSHDRIFDTGDIAGGATATFKAPSAPGSYEYICEIHQFMHGALTVK